MSRLAAFYEHFSTVAFVVVAIILVVLGIRNLLWNLSAEKAHYRRMVARGLQQQMALGATMFLVLGVLVQAAARNMPDRLMWMLLGLGIMLIALIATLVVRFGSLETPTLEQMPEDTVLGKRAMQRKVSGILFLFGAGVWVWQGAGPFLSA